MGEEISGGRKEMRRADCRLCWGEVEEGGGIFAGGGIRLLDPAEYGRNRQRVGWILRNRQRVGWIRSRQRMEVGGDGDRKQIPD